ncbi:MAG: toprim domain-containing protein, partial [Tannerella sp.]|nr:toprim domain-containing protein [Tannerella sp.]
EGFMDYLSYLTLKRKHHPEHPDIEMENDYVILNSVANLPKALDIIGSYETKFCFLDNDRAGTDAQRIISDRCGYRVSDQSVYYREYKDLNDYLCGKKLTAKQEVKKKKTGFKL